MNNRRKLVAGVILLFIGVTYAASLCLSGITAATDERATSDLPASTGPWTINGLYVHMTEEECRKIHDSPIHDYQILSGLSLTYPDSLSISFNEHRRADSVYGTTLEDVNGKVVLTVGSSRADVLAVLPDARERTRYSNKSGFFSFGEKHIEEEIIFVDPRAVFSITMDGDTVRRFHARRRTAF